MRILTEIPIFLAHSDVFLGRFYCDMLSYGRLVTETGRAAS